MDHSLRSSSPPSVVIAGGGLAGIAAATVLVKAGLPITLLEARQALGGRASSYVDAASGLSIDNCQHVSMGCCTVLQELSRTLGILDLFQQEECLYFISSRGKCTRFRADPLPAPLHLSRAFLGLPYLSWNEKFRFARGVGKLAGSRQEHLKGMNFRSWLEDHGQTEHLIRNVWEVVLVSALSESLDRIDAAYARKVFVDGFLANRHGWTVSVPQVNLDELYSVRSRQALQDMGVQVRCQSRVTAIQTTGSGVSAFLLGDEAISGEEFILALPHHHLAPLVQPLPALQSLSGQIARLETAPITSVHLWFDRPVTELPHAVFVNCLSQWVFSRGVSQVGAKEGFLYQVVISASRQLSSLSQNEVVDTVVEEISTAWPDARNATLLHSRMITERRAVFSAVPGVDQLRPAQQSAIPNLQLAGDWTQTGWPATMEGAARSGYLAAGNLLRRYGINDQGLPADLPREWLPRFLWGNA